MSGLTETIEAYLGFILSPQQENEPEDAKAETLARLLDNLAMQSNADGVYDPDAEDDDPKPGHGEIYDLVGRHFPELGYYNTVLDIEPTIDTKVALGDAIDDIADIAADLMMALNIARKYGEEAGQYEFKQRYRTHWGWHLRNLQLYLFCKLRGF